MPSFLVVAIVIVVAIGGFGILAVVSISNAPVRVVSKRPKPDARGPMLVARTPGVVEMEIPANGREQFTPLLEPGRIYRLRVTGVLRCHAGGCMGRGSYEADAAYATDDLGNFKLAYRGVLIGRKSMKSLDDWQEDRYNHEYNCVVDGEGKRLPVIVLPPSGMSPDSLRFVVETLPVGTLSPTQQRELREKTERRAKEADQKARERAEADARRQQEELKEFQKAAITKAEAAATAEREQRYAAEKLRAEQAVIDAKVRDLAAKVHHERNFLDAEYRELFVKQHQQELLGPLKATWKKEYLSLMSQPDLVLGLRQQAPQVLEWFECRVEMIVLAERLAVSPPDTSIVCSERRITARSIGTVQTAVNRLFELRDQIDWWREADVLSGSNKSSQNIQGALRVMQYQFEFLKSYGITADTPEQAEDRFFELCPFEPVQTLYEQFIQRIQDGEQVSPDAVRSRLEDLFREEIILQAKRRRMIRTGRETLRDAIDIRLSLLRGESTQLRDFLKSIGCSVEFQDHREREESREDQFFKLMQEKQNIILALQREGDTETVEHVQALYAQERARLFGSEEENYT